MICLLAGCQQLSKHVRKESPSGGPPPEFQSEESDPAQPTPRLAKPAPVLPPPAPPIDGSPLSLGEGWKQEPIEIVDNANEEFFPEKAAADVVPDLIAERAAATTDRYAAEGRKALQRQEQSRWPVIAPRRGLLRAVAQPPTLTPVPR
jgi:hypothetical protein